MVVDHAPTFTRTPFEMAQGRFANAEMVDPALTARVNRLKTKFLKTATEPDPAVAEHYARYRELFSPAGLEACRPQDLKDFVSTPTGANPGNIGHVQPGVEAARRGRRRRPHPRLDQLPPARPGDVPLEDRLTHLIEDQAATGMPGFKEALLTKVLCVMSPTRFLPILTYGTEGTGKHDLALALYGLHLPKVDDRPRCRSAGWRCGRTTCCSSSPATASPVRSTWPSSSGGPGTASRSRPGLRPLGR